MCDIFNYCHVSPIFVQPQIDDKPCPRRSRLNQSNFSAFTEREWLMCVSVSLKTLDWLALPFRPKTAAINLTLTYLAIYAWPSTTCRLLRFAPGSAGRSGSRSIRNALRSRLEKSRRKRACGAGCLHRSLCLIREQAAVPARAPAACCKLPSTGLRARTRRYDDAPCQQVCTWITSTAHG